MVMVSYVHWMNADEYDCNKHIHTPFWEFETLDLLTNERKMISPMV